LVSRLNYATKPDRTENYVEKQPKKPLLIAVDTQTNETIIKDGIPLKVGR